MWPFTRDDNFTSANALFGAVRHVKNADKSKYKYSGYGIGFNNHGTFSMSDGSFGKSVIIFDADMSSSGHIDDKGKYILILGEDSTQGLNCITLTAEKKLPD